MSTDGLGQHAEPSQSAPLWVEKVESTRWRVPGIALAAWNSPEGSSLVVYRTLPVPGGTPDSIAEALVNRMENLPGVEIREFRTESVGGIVAAGRARRPGDRRCPGSQRGRVVRGARRGKHYVPTRQVTLGFFTEDRTIYLRWHLPDSLHDRIAPDIRATIESLRIAADGHRPAG